MAGAASLPAKLQHGDDDAYKADADSRPRRNQSTIESRQHHSYMIGKAPTTKAGAFVYCCGGWKFRLR